MERLLRQEDIISRFGGDEFIIILPTNKERSCEIAERLRSTVESNVFKFEDKEIKFTISIGLISVTDFNTTVSDWVKRADELLYKAKSEGRNKICY